MNIVSNALYSISNKNIVPVISLIVRNIWEPVFYCSFEQFFSEDDLNSGIGFLTEKTLHEYRF